MFVLAATLVQPKIIDFLTREKYRLLAKGSWFNKAFACRPLHVGEKMDLNVGELETLNVSLTFKLFGIYACVI
jgi:hypothetical protein